MRKTLLEHLESSVAGTPTRIPHGSCCSVCTRPALCPTASWRLTSVGASRFCQVQPMGGCGRRPAGEEGEVAWSPCSSPRWPLLSLRLWLQGATGLWDKHTMAASGPCRPTRSLCPAVAGLGAPHLLWFPSPRPPSHSSLFSPSAEWFCLLRDPSQNKLDPSPLLLLVPCLHWGTPHNPIHTRLRQGSGLAKSASPGTPELFRCWCCCEDNEREFSKA